MHFPTWVDLKGQDAVPETVHHVVICNLVVLQRFYLTIIPRARMSSESIAYEAEGRMGV